MPMLAVSVWVPARAKESVPLVQGLHGSFLCSTKPTFAPFFGQLRHGAKALSSCWSCWLVWGWRRRALSPDVLCCRSLLDPVLSFMVRICSGGDLWLSVLGSCPLPVLHLSPPLASWQNCSSLWLGWRWKKRGQCFDAGVPVGTQLASWDHFSIAKQVQRH